MNRAGVWEDKKSATSFLMGALGAAQAQKAVGQDAGFEKGIEVSFDEDARSRH